ncbi:MAG: thioredoxin domain-containing protein, partial [Gemmatimonadetes bacterium]|nr:thioredoxin domain-containing protein [Gemmatimonadota bacterium]
MANRLQHETSPYLLQHRDNPVDWYPWGQEALDEAARSGRPVFLSIGYSACHWCHVMERESFEDEKTAAFLNENFVNIKVDREERPDLDSIYMDAVQAMTGHGGWPMSVFLTPDGKPFYGGTYYPPEDRQGMPSFRTVLAGVLDAYQNRREEVARQSEALLQHVQRGLSLDAQGGSLNASLPDAAVRKFQESFDGVYGGFGSAPKFPQPMNLDFLVRYLARTDDDNARDMIALSLEKMAGGGIYDQIGGGFHRYSVDAYWLVPHFEKMLYDNALLARLYLHAFLITGDESFRRVTEQTLDYILREMTDPSGGFYSSQDADSEGEEGTFFLWSPAEIRAALPDKAEAELLISFYEVTDAGNFEGRNILHRAKPVAFHAKARGTTEDDLLARLDRARSHLYEARAKRIAPGRDDKVIASWNGLALAAFSDAARYLNREDYRAAAVANAEFLANEIIENKRYR